MGPEVVAAKITKILVAVDGSDFAERAGLTAVNIARRYSIPVVLLHVANYPANTLGSGSVHTVSVGIPLADPIIDRQKQRAISSMDRIGGYATKRGVDIDKEIIDTSSSIANTIADFAYRNEVDLIVAGTRGTNEFKSAILGSVSEEIFQVARCSAMVVK